MFIKFVWAARSLRKARPLAGDGNAATNGLTGGLKGCAEITEDARAREQQLALARSRLPRFRF